MTVPIRWATRSEARLPPGTTTVSNTSRKVIAASDTPNRASRAFKAMAAVTAQGSDRVQDFLMVGHARFLTCGHALSRWAAGSSKPTTDNQITDTSRRPAMKIRNSLKSLKARHRDCRVIRRRGRTYVINKTNRRFKARQG